ncbi:MAG: radical SAM protein [Candidatus Hydrogenedentes bacterium]|nr:radical SAM protein [Candidatus Hydrogenedentota bacterium]
MANATEKTYYHLDHPDWLQTPEGVPRGYIQPRTLRELWFHTGTACNLACPFCLEGSAPGEHRLEQVTFEDVRPFMDEALNLGLEQFSFTGGEPFINKDIFDILRYGLARRPCMVLTNGTKPVTKRWERLLELRDTAHPLRFRVSLDVPDPERHDAGRGKGNFALALDTLARLHGAGFGVSIARHMEQDEDRNAVEEAFRQHFRAAGLPEDLNMVAFPDFFGPSSHPAGVPHITENCMTQYQTEASRGDFMCSFSKMVVKRNGRMGVYACTLVDDDADYDLGETLSAAMTARVMLRHHRCFSCFQYGASCSEC